ncbi:hypothetical protein EON82_08145 [bacterium]|nr:MAG: hypothetical protein EON82_08145 [bacterium]
MSRYALWTRRPEDPKSALRWVVWGDRHLTEARRRVFHRLVLAALAVCGLLVVLDWAIALFLYVPLVMVGLALYARPGASEHANLPALGGSEAFPVTIQVSRKGRRIGRENGWVAFVDGWLVYEGLRTSFSLRTCDVSSRYEFGGYLFLKEHDGTVVRMFLLTDFMQTSRPGRWRDRRRMREAFEEWRNTSSPVGEPVLPPREVSLRTQGEVIGERGTIAFALVFFGLLAGVQSPHFVGVGVLLLGLMLAADVTFRTRRLRRELQGPLPSPLSSLEESTPS